MTGYDSFSESPGTSWTVRSAKLMYREEKKIVDLPLKIAVCKISYKLVPIDFLRVSARYPGDISNSITSHPGLRFPLSTS